jgi:hypothetical protein
MRVITRLSADAKEKFPSATFPLEYEILPGKNEPIYSDQGDKFFLNKIIHEPNAGKMMPVVILEIESDKTVLCG